jgi:hypothetical protein
MSKAKRTRLGTDWVIVYRSDSDPRLVAIRIEDYAERVHRTLVGTRAEILTLIGVLTEEVGR